MKYLMIFPSLLAVVFVGALPALARANECNQLTNLTFSAPVALPGVTLPAGTYRFFHPDCAMSSGLLRVSSEDGLRVYGTFVTNAVERTTRHNRPEVILAEMPAGQAEVLKAWFYPGETTGDALVYPKREATTVAEAPVQRVFATNGLS